jgi:hypothetical protein
MIGGLRAPEAARRAARLHSGVLPVPEPRLPSWAEAEARRAKCQQPALQQAAEKWWRMMAVPENARALPRESYVRLHLALYRALVPTQWDQERAEEVAMEDWRFDCGSDRVPAISKAQFYTSLFELADTCANSRCAFLGLLCLSCKLRRCNAHAPQLVRPHTSRAAQRKRQRVGRVSLATRF